MCREATFGEKGEGKGERDNRIPHQPAKPPPDHLLLKTEEAKGSHYEKADDSAHDKDSHYEKAKDSDYYKAWGSHYEKADGSDYYKKARHSHYEKDDESDYYKKARDKHYYSSPPNPGRMK